MRRLKILFYWLFKAKFNVNTKELIQFLMKPTVKEIGNQYIHNIDQEDSFYKVSFKSISYPLFWTKQFPIEGIYQVSAETFDKNDWHFYQKEHTEILPDEIILDIGTAEGLLPLTVIDRVKKIIMIEPSHYFCQSLQKTFASFLDKVQIINSAVGQTQGEVYLDESSLSSGISSKAEGHKVPLNTIDQLIDVEEKITYLKADIEGFEYDMLLGAKETIQRNKPKIAITTYHQANDYQKIINLIKSYIPEYQYYTKGVFHESCKPVMIHFYLD